MPLTQLAIVRARRRTRSDACGRGQREIAQTIMFAYAPLHRRSALIIIMMDSIVTALRFCPLRSCPSSHPFNIKTVSYCMVNLKKITPAFVQGQIPDANAVWRARRYWSDAMGYASALAG